MPIEVLLEPLEYVVRRLVREHALVEMVAYTSRLVTNKVRVQGHLPHPRVGGSGTGSDLADVRHPEVEGVRPDGLLRTVGGGRCVPHQSLLHQRLELRVVPWSGLGRPHPQHVVRVHIGVLLHDPAHAPDLPGPLLRGGLLHAPASHGENGHLVTLHVEPLHVVVVAVLVLEEESGAQLFRDVEEVAVQKVVVVVDGAIQGKEDELGELLRVGVLAGRRVNPLTGAVAERELQE